MAKKKLKEARKCTRCENIECIFVGGEEPCAPEYVLVGGGNDGKRVRVEHLDRGFQIPIPVNHPVKPLKNEPVEIHFEVEVYEPMLMCTGVGVRRRDFLFFRSSKISEVQALSLLIQGYRKCDSKNNRTGGRVR
jgi:hypothetical protein